MKNISKTEGLFNYFVHYDGEKRFTIYKKEKSITNELLKNKIAELDMEVNKLFLET